MKDYRERHESLIREAVECALIAKLATDEAKAANFSTLAIKYRDMAADIRSILAVLRQL